jgi:hypothetical protein
MFANSMVIMQSLITPNCAIINIMIGLNNGVESLYSQIEDCTSNAQKKYSKLQLLTKFKHDTDRQGKRTLTTSRALLAPDKKLSEVRTSIFSYAYQ